MNRKISVVTETWPPEINGVALTTQNMVSVMLSRGYEVDLFRLNQKQKCQATSDLNEHLLSGFSLPWYKEVRIGLPAIRYFKKHWQKKRPDVVQIVTEGPLGWAAMHTANRMKIPVISEFHTNFHQYSKYYHLGLFLSLATRYLRWFHNQSNLTLVATREMKNAMQEDGYKNMEVVSRGIDTGLFSPGHDSEALRKQWGLTENQLAIIHVGRLAHEKNLGLAVKAFRAIEKDHPDARMIFVGDGPVRASLEKNNPDFVFCGMQKGEALARHYASGDLFLSPSTSETFGNVTLEAMASGLAIVCFDYAAAKQHIVNEVHALSIPLNNNQQFIEAAVRLAGDGILRCSLAKAAFENIQQVSWDNTVDVFEKLVLSLVEINDTRWNTKAGIDTITTN